MTATPRLYTEGAKSKAARHKVDVFPIVDPKTYGPEFHRLPFSRAVEQDLLSDYKVVVLAVSEEHVSRALQAHLASASGLINLDDAAKIVGCWQALRDPENKGSSGGPPCSLRRAIAFAYTIKSSQLLEEHWDGIVERAVALLLEREREGAFGCETRHADISTTSRYAEVDLEAKRAAVEEARPVMDVDPVLAAWRSDADVLASLESL